MKRIILTVLLYFIMNSKGFCQRGIPIFLNDALHTSELGFDTKIESYIYTITEEGELEIKPFISSPGDINFTDETFYIEIKRSNAYSKQKKRTEYFRISHDRWRKIETSNEYIHHSLIEVFDATERIDTIGFCYDYSSGAIIVNFNKINEVLINENLKKDDR